MRIHHIGYLLKNIEKGINEFKKLGYEIEAEIKEDMDRKIKIAFMVNDSYRIELVQPIDSSSSYWELLKKYKNVAYHVCYQVKELEAKVSELKKEGYIELQKMAPASAIDNRKVSFLLHPNVGIIELVGIEDEGIRVSV